MSENTVCLLRRARRILFFSFLFTSHIQGKWSTSAQKFLSFHHHSGSFTLIKNFWMTPKWRNDTGMAGMKSRITTFFQDIWDDRNDENALRMTQIIILPSFLSFQQNVIPRHSTAQMTMEWMEWHWNDSILSTWTMIDGMTLKWWNDVRLMEKYWNEQGMKKWHRNDIEKHLKSKWLRNDGMA